MEIVQRINWNCTNLWDIYILAGKLCSKLTVSQLRSVILSWKLYFPFVISLKLSRLIITKLSKLYEPLRNSSTVLKCSIQVLAIFDEWISLTSKYFMYAQQYHMVIFLLKMLKEDLVHESKMSLSKNVPAKWLNYAKDFSIIKTLEVWLK